MTKPLQTPSLLAWSCLGGLLVVANGCGSTKGTGSGALDGGAGTEGIAGASGMGGAAGAGTGGTAGAAGTQGTAGTDGGAISFYPLDMNDVTILAPLPQSIATPVLLRGADLANDGTAFVPRELFDG